FQTPGTFRVASALVAVGPPVDVDDCVAAYGAEPEATVRRLTERLAWAIRAQIVEAEDQHTLELAGALERAWREERGGAADAETSLAWRREVMRAARARAERAPARVAPLRALAWRERLARVARQARAFGRFVLDRRLHADLIAERRALVSEAMTLAELART